MAHPLLVAYTRPGSAHATRAGFSVGKRVGNAVQRNRLRRRLREHLRRRIGSLKPGWDIVFAARTAAGLASYADLGVAVEQLLTRARLIRDPAPLADGPSA